jgi:hypothetical protein
MVRIDEIVTQVDRNCRISDARSWGYYSVCGLLLRLRELFKWEQGLEPWSTVDKEAVMSWIGERETEWEALEDEELRPIRIGETAFDPFDTEGINSLLDTGGFHYGAGHGMGHKPLFVLGETLSHTPDGGAEIFIIGKELVRDLSPVPAMNRDGVIIARRDPMKWYLWNRLEDAGMKKDSSLAALAVAQDDRELESLLSDPSSAAEYFEALAERETDVAVHHELGEIAEERRMDGAWSRALGRSCGKKEELLARGLKDVLADTGEGGRLAYIISRRSAASLGLYAAFSEGLHRKLFPGLGKAFQGLVEDGSWERVEEARLAAHERLRTFVDPMFSLFDEKLTAEERSKCADNLEDKLMG